MNYPLLNVFLSILFFFCWALWIFLVIWILIDVFRNNTIGGWAKAGWVILIVFLPLIGVLIYLGVHGKDIRERQYGLERDEAEYYALGTRAEAESDGSTSTAFQLSKLADLHDRGVLTDAEFEREKQKILA
jgi:putative oligomerization/nucleic acid binding protein/phospholipase D-like protein